jgi:hypothetical protein
MSLCAQCAAEREEENSLCPHHAHESAGSWAEANRLLCDWIHRGKPLSRLPPSERTDSLPGQPSIRPWTPQRLGSFGSASRRPGAGGRARTGSPARRRARPEPAATGENELPHTGAEAEA